MILTLLLAVAAFGLLARRIGGEHRHIPWVLLLPVLFVLLPWVVGFFLYWTT